MGNSQLPQQSAMSFSQSAQAAPVTEADVRALANNWYRCSPRGQPLKGHAARRAEAILVAILRNQGILFDELSAVRTGQTCEWHPSPKCPENVIWLAHQWFDGKVCKASEVTARDAVLVDAILNNQRILHSLSSKTDVLSADTHIVRAPLSIKDVEDMAKSASVPTQLPGRNPISVSIRREALLMDVLSNQALMLGAYGKEQAGARIQAGPGSRPWLVKKGVAGPLIVRDEALLVAILRNQQAMRAKLCANAKVETLEYGRVEATPLISWNWKKQFPFNVYYMMQSSEQSSPNTSYLG